MVDGCFIQQDYVTYFLSLWFEKNVGLEIFIKKINAYNKM